jgi:xanthine dehydrogenase iron-sulfur cluster and FAD-binding subunit A
VKHDGFQCGYCTPGQICSAAGAAGIPDRRDDVGIGGAAADVAAHPLADLRVGERDRLYERPATVADAARAVAGQPNARFIAGGTNLLDLMNSWPEAPASSARESTP